MTKSFKSVAVAVVAALVLFGCSVEGTSTASDDQSSGSAPIETTAADNQDIDDAEPASEMHGTSLEWELSDFEREGILSSHSFGDASNYEVGEPIREYSYWAEGGPEWEYLYMYPLYENGELVCFAYLTISYDNHEAIPEDATPADFEGKEGVDWIYSGVVKEDTGSGMNFGLNAIKDLKDQGAQAGIFVVTADGLWFFDGNELTQVYDNTIVFGGITFADSGYAPLGDVSDMSIFDDVVLSNPSHVVPLGE